jgi:N-acetylmuramoyl-L-alanine amidase
MKASVKKLNVLKKVSAAVALVSLLAAVFLCFSFSVRADAEVYRQGSKGDAVKSVQTALLNKGYSSVGKADGVFGPKTTTAVKAFQKANKLTADGIVGPATLKALGLSNLSAPATGGVGKYTAAEVTLLARCIYGEARGEPYTGQVAVGAVILNRVRHRDFPGSISGVIYQPYAFTAVSDGQINLTPNQSCYNAARDAMNGWDPTYGCIYYYNPRTATSQWIFSREVKLTIGQHRFAV